MGSSNVPVSKNSYISSALLGAAGRPLHTFTARIQRPHVEDIHALHLSEDFQSLETSRLLEIGGNGTGLGARWEKVVLGLDACEDSPPRSAIALPLILQWCLLTIKRLQQLAVPANLRVGLFLPYNSQSVPSAMFLFREALNGRTSSDRGGE